MAKKIWLGSVLVLVILTASFYILMPEKVRIDFEKTRTIFKVYEEDKFVISGVEYVRIFDGSTKMRAKNRTIDYDLLEGKTMAERKSMFKDGIVIEEIYEFNNDVVDVENVPVSHNICFSEAEGKIFEYMIDKINYDGETKDITSPFSFGKNMKLTFQDGYYRAKVYNYKYASDKIKIRYRVTDDYQCFDIRLFDPEKEKTNFLPTSINYKNNNMTIEFKQNNIVIGQTTLKSHTTYDEIRKVTTGKNRTIVWYEFSDFKDVKKNALKEVEFIDMREFIVDISIEYKEFEEPKIISNPNYLLPIEKNYSFVYQIEGNWLLYDSLDIPKENIIIGVQTDLFWGEFLDVRFNVFNNKFERHAIVEGVSAGFMTEAPEGDPEESSRISVADVGRASKFDSPAGATKVTEIGWYSSASSSSNIDVEVGLYSHNGGSNVPDALLGGDTSIYAGGEGWVRIIGLDIPVDSSTTYWLAVWANNVADDLDLARSGSAGDVIDYTGTIQGLAETWVSSWHYSNYIGAVYAVYEGISDTCTCPGLNQNWEVDHGDYCNLGDCELGTGYLNYTGNGETSCTGNINTTGMGEPKAGNILWINDSNCIINVRE